MFDPFCGCGTTVHAAEKLGRQWIGIDVTHLAIGLIEFEKWALALIDAQPGTLGKKGADRGLDGRIYYGKTGHGIVSVKADENIGVSMILDLKGVNEREKAGIGVFLTLTEPTKPMITEAASAGLHEEPGFAPVPASRSSPSNRLWPCANTASNCPPAATTPSNAPRAKRTPAVRARLTSDPARRQTLMST